MLGQLVLQHCPPAPEPLTDSSWAVCLWGCKPQLPESLPLGRAYSLAVHFGLEHGTPPFSELSDLCLTFASGWLLLSSSGPWWLEHLNGQEGTVLH